MVVVVGGSVVMAEISNNDVHINVDQYNSEISFTC